MSKGVVLHIDNEEEILKQSKRLFDRKGYDLNYVTFKSKTEFDSFITANNEPIKSLIFDLMSSDPSKGPDFIDVIDKSFLKYNVPVFIYSGYLQSIGDRFDNNGTVYKYDKQKSIEEIFNKIEFYNNSGFIDLFCPGGELELEINRELNTSFTKQFSKNEELEKVINSITVEPDPETGITPDKSSRVKDVFKRIAIKSLSADLLSPIAENKDKVHPIEHFYRRQNKLPYWTGDIWKNKADGKTHIIVLTPRCDILNEKVKHLLVCYIEPNEGAINLSGSEQKVKDKLRKYLTDNLDTSKTKRYIPETVFFKSGGLVNLSSYHTIEKTSFERIYEYLVTLSDDFTNEILGKLSYFFLRTGISTINELDFKATIETLSINPDGEE